MGKNNEIYEESDLDQPERRRANGIVGLGAIIAFLILLTLFIVFSTDSEAQIDPVKIQVEQFIPADTCMLVYDMTGFSGRTLLDYCICLDSYTRQDGLFFLFSPHLLAMYHVEFGGRKACLQDLLDQAVSGTDLTWKCEGANILIHRK